MDSPAVYIPIDWRHALARGEQLPEAADGSALFADISGFTPLTEALALELGPRRGAEELTVHLNKVYDRLIAVLHRYGGSVIGFSGDAITCWLDQDNGARATRTALAMQQEMQQFAEVRTHSGRIVSLGMKAAVATGPVRRFAVGDPEYARIDVMAGRTLERLAAAEHQAERGDVIVDEQTAHNLGDDLVVAEWRVEQESGRRFARVSELRCQVPPQPWPPLADDRLSDADKSAWLLPPIYTRLSSGQGEFLAELRPAVALFMRFGGIDYDNDAAAPAKLDEFIRRVEALLTRYDGNLLQLTIGDKGSYLYAAFGAPIAHEDDAVRAASTALELQSVAAELDYLDPPQIGITVGRMRTGAYGSKTRRTYGVLGDAVNLSARLMSAAQPGQILVSDEARRATAELFAWEALPNIRVKGKSEPVTLSQLKGFRRVAPNLQEPNYTLPMVGRADELATIGCLLQQATAGSGQIVGVTAEAGMGKSRLAAEVIRLALNAGCQVVAGECQSYGTTTSYLVWQNVWRALFDLDSTAPPPRQIEQLQAHLTALDPGLTARLPLLGPLLNLPIADNELTASLDAKVRKESLETLLVTLLRMLANGEELLIVLEDIHWIDPLSSDLTVAIGRAIGNLPITLLLVYRPPDKQRFNLPPVHKLAYFNEIALLDFSEAEATRLIELKLAQFFGEAVAVPDHLKKRISEQASGNPFYIEELLNYLRDLGVDPGDSQQLDQVKLPNSVYNLVLSRIDRLRDAEQITIKVASVIGRTFRAQTLSGVYPQLGDADAVRRNLEALHALDLTPLDVPEPELIYLFKHIITQQVSYESLLFSTRARLHGEIGRYIELRFAERIDQFIDLLAYHYEHSNDVDKQRYYFLVAGDAAAANYANAAAISYYRKALPLLAGAARVDAQLKLGKVLELTADWGAAAAEVDAALELAAELGDGERQAWAETATAELQRKQGKYQEAAAWLQQAQQRFEQIGNQVGVGQALHYAGTVAAQQGDFAQATTLYRRSLAIREQLADVRNIASLYSNLGIVARYQGDIAEARRYYEESLTLREQLADPWSIAVSLNNLGQLVLNEGDPQRARPLLERALEIWRTIGERWATANTLHNLANVARDEGDDATARRLYQECVTFWQELDDNWALAYWLEDTALWAVRRQRYVCALELAGRADRMRSDANIPLAPAKASELTAALQPARDSLSADQQQQATTSGATLTLDAAISKALDSKSSPGCQPA